jgi:HK97 family phage prohead protease
MDSKQIIFKTLERTEKGIRVIASDDTLDRQGERVIAKGWDLNNFMGNPVMLVSHDYKKLPVGTWKVYLKDDKLIAEPEKYAKTQDGKDVKSLVDDGILNAVSVGFIPLERDSRDYTVITKAELLEISWVSVPANPNALRRALEKGFNPVITDELQKELDKEEVVKENRKAKLKMYRKALKELQDKLGIVVEGKVEEEVQLQQVVEAVKPEQKKEAPQTNNETETLVTDKVTDEKVDTQVPNEQGQATPVEAPKAEETPIVNDTDAEVAEEVKKQVQEILSKFI